MGDLLRGFVANSAVSKWLCMTVCSFNMSGLILNLGLRESCEVHLCNVFCRFDVMVCVGLTW